MDAVDEYIPTPPRDTEKPFMMPVEDMPRKGPVARRDVLPDPKQKLKRKLVF